MNLPLDGVTTPLVLEDSSTCLEDALKTFSKRRRNWGLVFTASTRARRRGTLEPLLEAHHLDFTLVPVAARTTVCLFMVAEDGSHYCDSLHQLNIDSLVWSQLPKGPTRKDWMWNGYI